MVVIATFATELDAQVAQAVLQSNDIASIILRDDAGGMLPSLHILSEVRLAVNDGDEEEARALLEDL